MADRVGQQLGNYRLLRLLGEGGFAEVYLGEHLYLGTQAAIKVLHTRLARDDLDGFLNEARTIAALKHPHIVRVLDFGVEGGTPFLVMDYAPGGTLRERFPKGTLLSPVAILPAVRQAADALQYAHDLRLIHRDVKPENMLLDEREQIMLSDFGIATIAQSSRYQQTEGVAGTAAYMAPEQLQGRPRPASDQYSLGIVIYEWLTGARPFQGSFAEIASQHLFVPPPPLREKLPAISPAVEQVVLRALAKDPTERFASVQDFATAFEQASQRGQSTRIRPTSELSPTLPAAAPPVTTPRKRSAWEEPMPAGEPPVTSGMFAPTRRAPPQPAEPAPRARSAAPPSPPLAPTVRVAAPSTEPAPAQGRARAKSWWVQGLLVGLAVLVVVGGSLVGLKLAGKGPLAPTGSTSNGATATTCNGAAPTTSSGGAAPTATTAPKPVLRTSTEFAVPAGHGAGPWGITVGPDGNLWFTEYFSNRVGRITPSGRITEFLLPNPNSNPAGITAGPDGNLWFTEVDGYRIGRISPGGTITEFALSSAIGTSWGITTGPDGNLWFTDGGQVGRISPGGTITGFALPTGYGANGNITVGPDGNLWFTESGDRGIGCIGRITPGGTITEFALSTTTDTLPRGITAGPDGNLWFTEYDSDRIGRITPEGSVTEFVLPTATSAPAGITVGPDGNLWFTEEMGNQIGRITPGGSITEFAPPTARGPHDITAGPDGNLWFTEYYGDQIGRISPGP